MRHFGPRSRRVYGQLCPELQEMCDYILQEICDISLTTGHRTESEQNALYPTYTKVQWPNSKHNTYPAIAVDLQPYPYPKSDVKLRTQLAYIAGRVIEWGKAKGYDIRWGGDWDQDHDLVDNMFDDLFHFEVRLCSPPSSEQ